MVICSYQKIQPILREEGVIYVNLKINGGNVRNGSKITRNDMNSQGLRIARKLIKKRKRLQKFWQSHYPQKTCLISCFQNSCFLKHWEYWIGLATFFSNSKTHRSIGPLTTNELSIQRKLIIKELKLQYSGTETFKINQKQFNLKVTEEGLYQSFGRILDEHHIFITKESVLAGKLVQVGQFLNIRGGVTLIMARIRSK